MKKSELRAIIKEEILNLKELFDTKKKLKWENIGGYLTAKFVAPNRRKYEITLASVSYFQLPKEAKAIIKKIMSRDMAMDFEWSGYLLEFTDLGLEDKGQEITGLGGEDTSKIFGIIGNAVVDKIKSKNIPYLYFAGKESSRIALYSRLAPLMARMLGYNEYHEGGQFFLSKEPFDNLNKKVEPKAKKAKA